MKLIIGLGNPGPAYEQTRHNAGSWLVTALADAHHTQFRVDKKAQAELADLEVDQNQCKLLLPLTFMNVSGQPCRAVAQFYRIEPQDILVVHDELDLPPGCIRLKTGGGHGGHNGLKDIIAQLGSSEFHRLRIGIGHPGHKDLVHSFVLGKPSLSDKQQMEEAIARGISIMPLILSGQMAKAMNQLNSL